MGPPPPQPAVPVTFLPKGRDVPPSHAGGWEDGLPLPVIKASDSDESLITSSPIPSPHPALTLPHAMEAGNSSGQEAADRRQILEVEPWVEVMPPWAKAAVAAAGSTLTGTVVGGVVGVAAGVTTGELAAAVTIGTTGGAFLGASGALGLAVAILSRK